MTVKEIELTAEDIINARIDGMLCRAEEAGINATKIETAERMLEKEFSIEDNMDITGLSKKVIENLQ